MPRRSRFALILGLAGATSLIAAQAQSAAQKDSEAAGVAAAIRFQKAEQAAADRQARIETARERKGETAREPAIAAAKKPSHAGGVAEAIRFQRAEQAAANRQARIEAARESAENAADRMAPQPARKQKPQ
ncbi:MAG TPA: hypothetical protein VMG35_30635 [Bryobacteraceae bacterium]|nr:hypothetical protein [Bryobacteraceae bacterium]